MFVFKVVYCTFHKEPATDDQSLKRAVPQVLTRFQLSCNVCLSTRSITLYSNPWTANLLQH